MYKELPYKERFVAFLDILGFTKMVYSNDEIDKAKIYFYQTKIKDILKQLKNEIENINEKYANKNGIKSMKIEFNYVVISDSIIITVDIIKKKNGDTQKAADDIKSIFPHLSSTEDYQKLGEMMSAFKELYDNYVKLNQLAFAILCEKISLLQFYLASKDIWLRGAITSGETFIDSTENQIIGKAYIEAHKLESEYAKYPRVIIDSKLIKELEFKNEKEFLEFYNQNYQLIFNWENHTIEKDIPLFISFISYVDNLVDEKEATDLLENIVNYIQKNIYINIGLYKKYLWLVQYTKDCIRNRKDNKYRYLLEKLEELG